MALAHPVQRRNTRLKIRVGCILAATATDRLQRRIWHYFIATTVTLVLGTV